MMAAAVVTVLGLIRHGSDCRSRFIHSQAS
jgi:hypothetical protein